MEYQLHHFAKSFGKWPWEVPDDVSLVAPHLAIMAADAKAEKKATDLAKRRASRRVKGSP